MNTPSTAAPRTTQTLKAAIAGQVFVRGEADYDQARRVWNLAVDQRPAVVVEAGPAADVVQAVWYARAHGMRIAPQGTGHGRLPPPPAANQSRPRPRPADHLRPPRLADPALT